MVTFVFESVGSIVESRFGCNTSVYSTDNSNVNTIIFWSLMLHTFLGEHIAESNRFKFMQFERLCGSMLL